MKPLKPIFLLLLIATAILVLVSISRSWREATPWSGMMLEERGVDGVLVERVIDSSPAEAAGLERGDRLIEIGGAPVQTRLVAMDRLQRVVAGSAVGVRYLRGDEVHATTVHTAAIVTWHWDRMISVGVALLFCLGGIAVLMRPRGTSADPVYAAWCLAGAVLLGVSWSARGTNVDWMLFWSDRAARLLFPALLVHLVLALRTSKRAQRRWLPVVYAPALALMLAEIHVVGLGGALRSADPIGMVELLQNRIEVWWIAFGLLLGAVLLIPAAFARTRPRERARARWLLVGATLGIFPYVLLSAIPQITTGTEPGWSWVALPALALVPLAFTTAVIEYRLMDLALFGRRTIEVTAMLAISLILFLGFFNLLNWVLPPLMSPTGLVPALVAAVLTAVLAPTVRAGTRDLVGRLYYRRRYSFRRALNRVARELNSEQELTKLTDVLQDRIGEALDAQPVWLLLTDEQGRLLDPRHRRPVAATLTSAIQQWLVDGQSVALADIPTAPTTLPLLHQNAVQTLVPLRVRGKLIAVLAVGPRRSGGLLDSDDLELLRSVAAHAAAAVAGALHLDELRQQVHLVEQLKERNESLIASSPIGMAMIGADGEIQHWNPALSDLFGETRGEVLGRSYGEVLPTSLHPMVTRGLSDDAKRESIRSYRLRVDGTKAGDRWLNLAATPLTGAANGNGLLLSIDDVTEQVRLEQKLIQQDRLASVGMLAAGVAHEVNTPLTGISSYAQILLQETEQDDPRRPMLDKVVKQADRASQIARGLLSISRPGNKGDLAMGPVELRELIEETLSLLGVQLTRARIEITKDWNGVPVVAQGDRSRLQQVVMNLMLNAIDASSINEQPQITVRTGLDGTNQPYFEIVDNGDGISEEARDKLFDPFFTTKKPGKGTGLGLSISYAIVREHGGTIAPTSDRDRGTTMRVVLPTDSSTRQPEVGRRAG